MISGNYNIPNTVRGDTWDGMTMQFLTGEDDTPVDITGAVCKMILRDHPTDTDAIMTFDTADSTILISDAVNGEVTLPKRLIDIPARNYYWDFELTIAPDVKTYIGGRWNVKQDVT